MDRVALHGVEERLHVRVVGDLAWSIHALHEAERGEPLAERVGGILHPTVAVEDHAGARAATEHGVIERRQCEPRAFGRAQAPAEAPARGTPRCVNPSTGPDPAPGWR